jgi:cation diffusion facilitator CzcD-associated flavoprotein CzcO
MYPGLRLNGWAGSQAVVGAGAAGLAAAKELREEGHNVDVFEKLGSIGGTWVFDERVESDPLGLSSRRSTVHSSLYASLRVNLPREIMSFSDFPFLPECMQVRTSSPCSVYQQLVASHSILL